MVLFGLENFIGILKKKGCIMKRRSLMFLIVLMAVFLVLGGNNALASSWPETVRIGLYYGGSSVASVSFSSKSGLEVGSFSSNSFDTILTMQGGSSVIIRKDAFHQIPQRHHQCL